MAHLAARNILVFGGTGAIGRYITSALLHATPPFASVTLFTSPGTASSADKAALLAAWRAQGLRVTTGDVTSQADVTAAYRDTGADTVVSAVGRAVLQHQVDLLRWAEASEGVKWFLPSEYGTDVEYGPKSAGEKPHQNKLMVRKFVKEEVTRVKVTYVVTGPYFEMWVDPIRGVPAANGIDAKGKKAVVIDDGEGKIGFCTMVDVGKFVVAALQHPDASAGKALKVQSFVVTPNQVVAAYEKATGSKFDVSHTSLDELRGLEEKAWADGYPAATGLTLRRIWAEGGTLYEKNDNEDLRMGDQKLESLDEAVGKLVSGKGDEF